MIRAFRCLLPVLVLVLGAGVASAQVATGTQPFGSFGGGPEAINLGNLNAHWTIPIFSKPGRGTPLTVELGYDTSIWSRVLSWQPVNTSYWGWTGLGSAWDLGGQISGPSLQFTNTCEVWVTQGYYGWWQIEGYYATYGNWVYQDKFNVPHPFSLTLNVVTAGSCAANGVSSASGTFTSLATDGSGYTLQVTANGYGSFSASIITADGTVIVPGSSLTDRNGNQITLSNGVYADTLGTTALTVSSFTPPTATTFQYTAPSGAQPKYWVNYTNYTVATNFGVSGMSEYKSSAAVPLVSSIVLPDGSQYTFQYESTPSTPASGACTPYAGTTCVTARLTSVTLPTGGTITYNYTGGNNGMLRDGSTAGLKRYTPDTGSGYWEYDRTTSGTGAPYTTTVTDPLGNQTVIQFQTSTSNSVTNYYETQRQTYQGSVSAGTLLQTVNTCYNGASSPCTTTAITPPVASRRVWPQFGSSGLTRTHGETYGSYGWFSTDDENYLGLPTNGLPGRTVYRPMATLGNNINSMPSMLRLVDDYSGAVVSQSVYGYDGGTVASTSGTPQHVAVSGARGNLTGVTDILAHGRYISYYDTGVVSGYTDSSGAQTTYKFADATSTCGNAFPSSSTVTGTGLPAGGLVTSFMWNCTGGVQTQVTDANNQTTKTAYTDPYFWRPSSVTDPTGVVTSFCYGMISGGTCNPNPNQTESVLNFNSGSSTVDVLTTLDGLGRAHLKQTRQSPSATTYDAVETDYDSLGRVSRVTLPCPVLAGQGCSGTWPGTTTTYDALSRPLTVTDGGGGSTQYSYNQNDVLVTVLPAPSGEQPKQRQLEYDGLGRVMSVCEITGASGSGTCGQTNGAVNGFWTQYTYDLLDNVTSVTQNGQGTSAEQTRTYWYDPLGRLWSETNPESGTTTYAYDSDSTGTCAPSVGDLVKRVDAQGNTTCYTYDALHRKTSITYSGPYGYPATPNKYFIYDSATVNGALNTMGRLAEAYTAQSQGGSKLTDEDFSYSPRGEVWDVYQATPNSNGYYYHAAQQYWPHGLPLQLSFPGLPTISYGVDGEGRTSTVSASSGQSPVTSTFYNSYGTPPQTTVTLGSGDTDVFTFDPSTGRMTQYQYNVGNPPRPVTGNLAWNPNGTLAHLVINDSFDSANNQTCSYSSDDLTRVSQGVCGTAGWGQQFSYDPFGNITKTVPQSNFGATFQPVYQNPQTGYTSNRYVSLPGATNLSYDTNGNVLNDGTHQYAWDADGNAVNVDGVQQTYDALDRVVEQNRSGVFTQIVYAPTGDRLALMNGQSLQKAFVRLPGAATAVYTAAGLDHYRHSDWLGSSRFASTANKSPVGASAGWGWVTVNGNEQSTGGTPTTPGSGTATMNSVTSNGTDQSWKGGGKPSTGFVLLDGSEQSVTVDPCKNPYGPASCPETIYDQGTISVTVGTFTATYSYGSTDTVASVMAGLANALSVSGSPVTASVGPTACCGTAILMATRTDGARYSVSTTSSTNYPAYFLGASFGVIITPINLFTDGMPDGTVYDAGSVWIAVNGTNGTVKASVSYGQNSTPSSLANSLVSAIGTSGSQVTATASGGVITLTATTKGTSTNYPLSCGSSTNYQATFNNPSFSMTCPAALSGGTNANQTYDTGSIQLTVNGQSAQASYGQSDTAATVAGKLVSAVNGSSLPVTASLSGTAVQLTAKTPGSATNYSLAMSCSYNQAAFSSCSFPLSGPTALYGGADASSASTAMYADQAYAPFGEVYAQAGATNDLSFTGMDMSATSGDYDFPAREYDATAGRWPSPDPAGLAAADPSDPQSWNRYAYVRNRPLFAVDPLGLDCVYQNNGGTGVESIDHNSNSDECAASGGDWVPGYVSENMVNVDENSGWVLAQNSAGQTFGSCNGGNCGSDTMPGWFGCFSGNCGSQAVNIPTNVSWLNTTAYSQIMQYPDYPLAILLTFRHAGNMAEPGVNLSAVGMAAPIIIVSGIDAAPVVVGVYGAGKAAYVGVSTGLMMYAAAEPGLADVMNGWAWYNDASSIVPSTGAGWTGAALGVLTDYAPEIVALIQSGLR
jgi:RHS repeat-associated protein